MADLKAGKNVCDEMKIGDTVIRNNGEVFPSDKYLCMDGQYAFLMADGGVEFHSRNPLTRKVSFLSLNEDEVAVLKVWLNSHTGASREL